MNRIVKWLIALLLAGAVCSGSISLYLKLTEPDYSNVPHPLVTIEMETGQVIRLELYPAIAPITVANFVTLIESGYYDGLIFHRVIAGFMIQGGDPNGDGTGGPGYVIKGEFRENGVENGLSHTRGVLSMARKSTGNDTAGSQFFIMHMDNAGLDGEYAAFGKVLDEESMAAVDEIATTKTDSSNKPLSEWKIKRMTVDTQGVAYRAVTLPG